MRREALTRVQGKDDVLDKNLVVLEGGALLGQDHGAEVGLVGSNVLGDLGDKNAGVGELFSVGGHFLFCKLKWGVVGFGCLLALLCCGVKLLKLLV